MMSRARSIACDSAEKIDALSGNLYTKTFPSVTAAAATAAPCFEPSVNTFL
jgi:hypothetical protein